MRNSLLIVAVVYLVFILRIFQSDLIAPKDRWRWIGGQMPGWLAWSLAAVGIGLVAKYFSARRLKWFQTVGWIAASCVISIFLCYILKGLFDNLFFGSPILSSFNETQKHLLYGWDLPIFGLILSINLALEYIQKSRQKEALASRLETELAVNRLATLKAQVQPHFLFNTLHIISALVKKDPDTAEEMIARLSHLLRASMSESDRPEVALTEELDILMNYVEIVQVRFKDRLCVELDIDPDAAEALVPALFLQPLVENAVRHGVAQNLKGGTVKITASRERQALVVRVDDTGHGFSGDREDILRRGSGLSNLQKRLELLYPGEHRLDLGRGDQGGARVVVEIPFRTKPREG
jgi:sensor histidine kinase YesM